MVSSSEFRVAPRQDPWITAIETFPSEEKSGMAAPKGQGSNDKPELRFLAVEFLSPNIITPIPPNIEYSHCGIWGGFSIRGCVGGLILGGVNYVGYARLLLRNLD